VITFTETVYVNYLVAHCLANVTFAFVVDIEKMVSVKGMIFDTAQWYRSRRRLCSAAMSVASTRSLSWLIEV
jgi:hypothetical protein